MVNRNGYYKSWRKKNKKHVQTQEKIHRRAKYVQKLFRATNMILEHYGHECKCCGEIERKFLTVDHINNDGFKLRGTIHRGTPFYFWLARQIRDGKAPKDLQILCYNCNSGRARNGGICPHKEKS